MRDGWFDHDSLSFATKTHPSFTNCFNYYLFVFINFPLLFSVCHPMYNWYFSIVVGGNHKGNF